MRLTLQQLPVDISALNRQCEISVPQENQKEWLESTAEDIVRKSISEKTPSYPNEEDDDDVYTYHRAVLNMGFLYTNLREAIRYENGPQIIRQWRFWLFQFLGSNRRNYACEAANLLANLAADWSPEIAHTHSLQNSEHGRQTRLWKTSRPVQ